MTFTDVLGPDTYIGQTVVFAYPENGYPYEQEKCRQLILGNEYIASDVDYGQSYTRIKLKAHHGWFNSVNFRRVNEDIQ